MAMVNIGINHGSNDFSWEHTCKLNANASVDANAHPPLSFGKGRSVSPKRHLAATVFLLAHGWQKTPMISADMA